MSSCKMLILGTPKARKTSALVSLANSGRKIRYIDFDQNYAPLAKFTTDAGRKNIQRIACIDETTTDVEFNDSNGEVKIVNKIINFTSWPLMVNALKGPWPSDGSDPKEWGNESVVVIDSLTSMSRAAERGFQKMNGRDSGALRWQEFRHVQEQVFEYLIHLGNTLKCPLVVLAHVQLNGPDLNPIEEIGTDRSAQDLQRKVIEKKLEAAEIIDWSLGPISTGRAKSLILPSIFSGVIFAEPDEYGKGWLYTTSRRGLQIGIPIPNVRNRYSVETGLQEIFDIWAPVKKETTKEKKEKE